MNEPIVERWIMCRAADDHVILEEDSIDERCLSHRGFVMAPNLACNVPGAVGQRAQQFNAVGRQVWTGKMMKTCGGKIVREGAAK